MFCWWYMAQKEEQTGRTAGGSGKTYWTEVSVYKSPMGISSTKMVIKALIIM